MEMFPRHELIHVIFSGDAALPRGTNMKYIEMNGGIGILGVPNTVSWS